MIRLCIAHNIGALVIARILKTFFINKIQYNYKLLSKISWIVFTTEETNAEFRTSCTVSSRALPAVSRTKYAVIWLTIIDARANISNSCAKDRLEGFRTWGIKYVSLLILLGCYRRLVCAMSWIMQAAELTTTGCVQVHILIVTLSSCQEAVVMSTFSESSCVCWWCISHELAYSRVYSLTAKVCTRCPAKQGLCE